MIYMPKKNGKYACLNKCDSLYEQYLTEIKTWNNCYKDDDFDCFAIKKRETKYFDKSKFTNLNDKTVKIYEVYKVNILLLFLDKMYI